MNCHIYAISLFWICKTASGDPCFLFLSDEFPVELIFTAVAEERNVIRYFEVSFDPKFR